jgi:chromosome segregation ATPase
MTNRQDRVAETELEELREKYEAMRLEWSKAVDERDAAVGWAADYKNRWETLGRVAKKKIDKLEARVAQLREELALRDDSLANRRVRDLKAEVERLREALDWMIAEPEDPLRVQLWARAALDGKPFVRRPIQP